MHSIRIKLYSSLTTYIPLFFGSFGLTHSEIMNHRSFTRRGQKISTCTNRSKFCPHRFAGWTSLGLQWRLFPVVAVLMSRSWLRTGGYEIGGDNTQSCSYQRERLPTPAECMEAAGALGKNYGFTGSYAGWPRDCFMYRDVSWRFGAGFSTTAGTGWYPHWDRLGGYMLLWTG